MTSTLPSLLAACLLTLVVEAQEPGAGTGAPPWFPAADTLHLFFVTDVHSDHARLRQVVEHANQRRPDAVVDGGDLVHDGVEAAFRRVADELARLERPWLGVRGNHDAERRGPFAARPPVLPAVRVHEIREHRLILLDNHDGRITPATFEALEDALGQAGRRSTLVVMHVPAVARLSPLVRLRHLVPFPLEEPVMSDAVEVERFLSLVDAYGVVAVLAGHTHMPSRTRVGGVEHIVGGALGGLTPGLGVANGYLDIRVVDGIVYVAEVPVGRPPPRNPASYVVRAFRFFARVNGTNHADHGWSFVPSTSVQLRGGGRWIEGRSREAPNLLAALSFERLVDPRGRTSFLGDLEVTVGERDLLGGMAVLARLRPLGDYNRGVFLEAGGVAEAGLRAASPAGAVGWRAGIGMEWLAASMQVSHSRLTGHRALEVTVGRRY